MELIQISIGNRQQFAVLPNDEDWIKMYNFAREQTLIGVLYSGIERLPEEQQPSRKLLLKWLLIRSKIIALGQLINKRAVEISSIFDKNGYKSCIIKGCSVARYYTNPEVRQSGDIDIWIEENRSELLASLREHYKLGQQVWHHTEIKFFDDVEVEVHHHPSWLCNPINNFHLQRFFRKEAPTQCNNAPIEGIKSPTPSFDAVFCLVHIYRHLFGSGIGLRQIMDYYYILKALSPEERFYVLKILKSIGMIQFTYGMMYVLQKVFLIPHYGQENSILLCEVNEYTGKFLLDEILKSGNFGRSDPSYANASKSRFIYVWYKIKRLFKFVKYYPEEVLWIPIWRLWHFLLWRPFHTVKNIKQ